MATPDTQLLKGVVAMLLLQLLAERESYGYEIVVRLHEQGFDNLAEGTVYPALTRLESRGLLESRLARSRAGPARKYYRPTGAGRAELARSVDAWSDLVGRVDRALDRAGTTHRPDTDVPDEGGPHAGDL